MQPDLERLPLPRQASGMKNRGTNLSTVYYWTRSLAVLSLFAAATSIVTLVADNNPLAAQVRVANDRFKDVAVAVAEGYAPVSCTGGAMGVHYVKASLIGETVDIRQPQAVMYEPKPNGKMELVAVEYITTKGPASLGGQPFSFTGTANRHGLPALYELHVWAWKANSRGAFAAMDSAAGCELADAM
jgi:hypothetical protein